MEKDQHLVNPMTNPREYCHASLTNNEVLSQRIRGLCTSNPLIVFLTLFWLFLTLEEKADLMVSLFYCLPFYTDLMLDFHFEVICKIWPLKQNINCMILRWFGGFHCVAWNQWLNYLYLLLLYNLDQTTDWVVATLLNYSGAKTPIVTRLFELSTIMFASVLFIRKLKIKRTHTVALCPILTFRFDLFKDSGKFTVSAKRPCWWAK